MIVPRPYQSEAVEAVYEHLRTKDNNPCVVLPTGTGKSLVLAQIAKDSVEKWNGRVLILAHVKELLEQNADKIRKLCPELKIGIYSAGLRSRDTTEQVIVAGIQSVYNKACELDAFDLVIVDECFPAGTLIDTPRGQIPIEDLYVGQPVRHALGVGNIEAISSRPAFEIMKLELSNGKSIECTPNHPFFTESGWCKASALAVGTCLFSREDVSRLRERFSSEYLVRSERETGQMPNGNGLEAQKILFPRVPVNGTPSATGKQGSGKSVHELDTESKNSRENVPVLRQGISSSLLPSATDVGIGMEFATVLFNILLQESRESNVSAGSCGKNVRDAESNRSPTIDSRREWEDVEFSTGTAGADSERGNGIPNLNNSATASCGSIALLQTGCGNSISPAGNTTGWREPFCKENTQNRQTDSGMAGGIRVVGITHIKLKSPRTVYNLQVAGHPSFYADGVLVHNCHLIAPEGDGMYRTFLADMKVINPHVRVIGLTATPFRLKGGLICKPENILNEICYEAGLKEMIQQGYLSPLISRAGRAEANLANLHIRGGEFISDEVAAAMDNEALVTSACREIVELTRDRKSVLIFTASVDHCKHVAEKIQAFSGKECAIVTGDTSPAERAEIIARFKGEFIPADLFGTPKPPLNFLANVNVLTCGFDAPNTDCVVLLRPTNSPGLLIQMVGRGTRLSPDTGKVNCIAEGTMILTDRGLVPIEKVTTQMKLWDGIEYVPHGGIVFKGERNVIEYAGLTATPDHKVWSEHHWRTHGECAASGKPISCTGIEGKAVREADGYFRYGSCQGGVTDSQTASAINAQTQVCVDAVSVRNGCMEIPGQSQKRHGWMPCLRQTAPCPEMAGCQDWKREGQMRESEQSPICGLRGTRNPVLFRRSDGYGTLADGALRLHGQEDANRQDRQQRKLRAWQCEDDDSEHQWNEQEASAQSENASVQAGTSGSAICGRNALQSDFTGFQQRGDCRTVQFPVLQTKRRVWDILNVGPRHRFTANGLLVSNCLVLDYGGNILRHGPLDMIKVKEPGSGKGGDAPAKKCPQCLALIHAGYTACPECGYVFPPKESNDKMTQTASSAGVISGQVDYTDYEVLDVYYCVHEKRGADPDAPKTMRVDYQVGFNEFKSEWVCPEHTGYARDKFEKWWHERAALGCPMPRSAREAVSLANEGLLAAPESITVKTIAGERFERVTGFRLKERPVMREPGEDLEVGETWTSPTPPDDLDDDIPF